MMRMGWKKQTGGFVLEPSANEIDARIKAIETNNASLGAEAKKTESDLSRLKGIVERMEVRLKQAECHHANRKFQRDSFFGCAYGFEVCDDCKKVLRKFEEEREFVEAQREYYAGLADKFAARVDALDKEV
jgi:primosomal protein N''